MKEASECSTGSSLQDKLAELDSIKPCPYGTLHAVGSSYFLVRHNMHMLYIHNDIAINLIDVSTYHFFTR